MALSIGATHAAVSAWCIKAGLSCRRYPHTHTIIFQKQIQAIMRYIVAPALFRPRLVNYSRHQEARIFPLETV